MLKRSHALLRLMHDFDTVKRTFFFRSSESILCPRMCYTCAYFFSSSLAIHGFFLIHKRGDVMIGNKEKLVSIRTLSVQRMHGDYENRFEKSRRRSFECTRV